MPLTLAMGLAAALFLAGPVWAIVVAVRLWKRQPGVGTALRRMHLAFLLIDALLMWYGIWALQAGAESAARGGGIMSGFGIIPIGLGCGLAMFSAFTLFRVRRLP